MTMLIPQDDVDANLPLTPDRPGLTRVTVARGVVAALVASALLFAAGCHDYYGEWTHTLRARAAFELNCPEARISMMALGDGSYGSTGAPLSMAVDGCGRRAVYAATYGGYVLNSDIRSRPPTTPESAPDGSTHTP